MGIFDKARKLARENSDKIDKASTKLGAEVNKRTHGKHADKIAKAQKVIRDQTRKP